MNRVVLYEGQLLDLDANSLRLLGARYVADAQSVYERATRLDDADIASFRSLGGGYAVDRKHVWLDGRLLAQARSSSFRVLDQALGIATDGERIWANGFELSGVYEPATFRVIDRWYATDENRVYSTAGGSEALVVPCPFRDFVAMGHGFGTDGTGVFFGTTTLEGALRATVKLIDDDLAAVDHRLFAFGAFVDDDMLDAQSFEVLKLASGHSTIYGRDARRVYSIENSRLDVLEGDVGTFEVLSEYDAKDAYRVWHRGYERTGPRAAHFELLSENLGRDDERVFHDGEPIERADAASFRSHDALFSQDRERVYVQVDDIGDHHSSSSLEVLEEADAATFEVLGYGYALDSTHVFHGLARVSDAEARRFRAVGAGYFTDGRRWWNRGLELMGVDSLEVIGDHWAVALMRPRDTIEVLGEGFASDGTDAWLFGESLRLPEVELIGSGYIRSSGRAFHYHFDTVSTKVVAYEPLGGVLEGARANALRLVGPGFATDGCSVYSCTNRLDDIDGGRAQMLGRYHVTDGQVLYAGPQRCAASPHEYEELPASYSDERTLRGYFGRTPTALYAGGISFAEKYEWNDQQKVLRLALDPRTFQVLDEHFGTDGRYIFSFWADSVCVEPDAGSFRVLGDGYALDSFHLFHASRHHPICARATEFEYLGGGYARTSSEVLYRGWSIDGAIPHTFRVLGDGYGADEHRVFRGREPLDLDVASTSFLSADVLSDDAGLFFGGMHHERVRTSRNFEWLFDGYWRNGDEVWCRSARLNGVTVANVTSLGHGYARADGRVYFEARLLGSR